MLKQRLLKLITDLEIKKPRELTPANIQEIQYIKAFLASQALADEDQVSYVRYVAFVSRQTQGLYSYQSSILDDLFTEWGLNCKNATSFLNQTDVIDTEDRFSLDQYLFSREELDMYYQKRIHEFYLNPHTKQAFSPASKQRLNQEFPALLAAYQTHCQQNIQGISLELINIIHTLLIKWHEIGKSRQAISGRFEFTNMSYCFVSNKV